MFDFVSILLHFFLDFIRNTIKKLLDKFGVEGRQAGDKNVVYIDESEVPEDIRNALKAAYVEQKKFLSLRPTTQKEDVAKLEAERDEAFKPLREISHREELTLTEFVQEFLNCIPDEI